MFQLVRLYLLAWELPGPVGGGCVSLVQKDYWRNNAYLYKSCWRSQRCFKTSNERIAHKVQAKNEINLNRRSINTLYWVYLRKQLWKHAKNNLRKHKNPSNCYEILILRYYNDVALSHNSPIIKSPNFCLTNIENFQNNTKKCS